MSEKRIHELFAGITAPRTTRERILFVATELFYTHGFNAVGLDQILTEADLTKTTFYNHFQSKDDLVEQAIQLRDQWETEAFTKALHKKAGYEPRSMLIAFFDVLHDWFTAPEFRGCLFLMAVTDYPVKHHPAHRAGAQHYIVGREVIERMAEAAGVRNPSAFAKQWSLLITGAVSQHLLDPDQQAALTAKEIAQTMLESHLSA